MYVSPGVCFVKRVEKLWLSVGVGRREKGFEVLKKGYGWIGGGRKCWAVELRFLECSRGEGKKKGVVGGEFGFLECSRGEKEEEEGDQVVGEELEGR
jgi:hypothetical protein